MTIRNISVKQLTNFNIEKSSSWDRWIPRGHFTMTHRFLRCALDVEIPGFSFVPLIIKEEPSNDLAGVAAAYYNVLDGAELGSQTLQRRIHRLRRLMPNLLRFSVLEIGNPAALAFPVRSSFTSKIGVEAVARWAMKRVKRDKAHLVVIRDFAGQDSTELSEQLLGMNFQAVPLPFLYVVSLDFKSFDDYRSAMRTRYRSRLDACMRDTADLTVEVLDDFGDLSVEMYSLWRDLFDRAKRYHRVVLTEAFFSSVSKLSDTRVLLLRRADQEIAGFGLLFLDGPVLRYSATGFTREAAVKEGVYFRMLYEVVRYGIENGFATANLGATTSGPKMSIGAQPVALHAWMWHPSKFHRCALGYLVRSILKPESPDIRNVFRAATKMVPDPSLLPDVRM